MILDTLDHAGNYAGLHPGLELAFGFLRRTDLDALPDGRIDLDGDRVYALLQSYATKPRGEGKPEAHRRYIDVQALLAGREACGYAAVSENLTIDTPYDGARDFMLFRATACDFFTLIPGNFAVFFPHDAHQPGCRVGGEAEAVRKVVVKMRLDA